MTVFHVLLVLVRSVLRSRAALAAEDLALRQQLAVLRRSVKRPKLRARDRLFWVLLYRLWKDWRSSLHMVQPGTVVKWHRQGFRLFWRWKSRRRKPGRPKVDAEIRDLVRRMSRENPLWGAPRILSELKLLGYALAKSTVEKYMIRGMKPPSQTWKTFLDNHVVDIAAIDFFTVPTATFRMLFCFLVLGHDRRKVMHFNVTEHPTEQWTAQQIVEAFPYDEAPKYLIRDRDTIYGRSLQLRIKDMGIEEVIIARRSPWQNPYVERLIGSIRRECLDHTIVLNEAHLMRILTDYFAHYHESRPHQSLGDNACPSRKLRSSYFTRTCAAWPTT
jgi:transposase InsO family protein